MKKPTVQQDAWSVVTKLRERSAPEKPPGTISASDYAERFKCSQTSARRDLARFFKSGSLTRIAVTRAGGGTEFWYSPVKK